MVLNFYNNNRYNLGVFSGTREKSPPPPRHHKNEVKLDLCENLKNVSTKVSNKTLFNKKKTMLKIPYNVLRDLITDVNYFPIMWLYFLYVFFPFLL